MSFGITVQATGSGSVTPPVSTDPSPEPVPPAHPSLQDHEHPPTAAQDGADAPNER